MVFFLQVCIAWRLVVLVGWRLEGAFCDDNSHTANSGIIPVFVWCLLSICSIFVCLSILPWYWILHAHSLSHCGRQPGFAWRTNIVLHGYEDLWIPLSRSKSPSPRCADGISKERRWLLLGSSQAVVISPSPWDSSVFSSWQVPWSSFQPIKLLAQIQVPQWTLRLLYIFL